MRPNAGQFLKWCSWHGAMLRHPVTGADVLTFPFKVFQVPPDDAKHTVHGPWPDPDSSGVYVCGVMPASSTR